MKETLMRYAAFSFFASLTLSPLTVMHVWAQSSIDVSGTYCLIGVREVGSCFRFGDDHEFEYFLSYGAYDEVSQGRWRIEGNDIVLESQPYDRRPTFVFKEARMAEGDGIAIIVVNAEGTALQGIDARVQCGAEVYEGYTQQEGFRAPCRSPLDRVALGLRVLGVELQPIAMNSPDGNRHLMFAFDPGDLGKKPFLATRLRRDGDQLQMIYRSETVRDIDGQKFSYRKN